MVFFTAYILQKNGVSSIQNRCVRTLANLALNTDLCLAIHNVGKEAEVIKGYRDEKPSASTAKDEDAGDAEDSDVISHIVKLLAKEENVDAKQTFLRALR